MALWNYNNITIYVQEYGRDKQNLASKLDPLGGGSIIHRWGFQDPVVNVEAYVLTSGDALALDALAETGASYELVGPEGSLGNWMLKSVNCRRESSVWHKFFDRPHLDPNTPLYRATMELWDDN